MMEVKGNCTECIGVGGCEKYCKLHIGSAIENMLNEVTFIKSDIGAYRSTTVGGKSDLIVSGHRIDSPGEDTYILTSINTMLDRSDKFNRVYNQNVISILTDYLNSSIRFTPEYKAEMLEKLRDINRNVLLPLPFKTHKMYDVNVMNSLKEIKGYDLMLDHIIWKTNKQTGKLEVELTFKQEYTTASPKYIKMKYEDYMVEFRPSKNGVYTDEGKYNEDLIRATSFGLFKPLEIYDGLNKIVVDNTYLYHVNNGNITIIGKWDSMDKIFNYHSIPGIEKTKAYKFIKDNLGTIRMHRKYIVPYNLAPLNTINI